VQISKLFLPFLMGVILKVASLVPVILSIMSAMALYGFLAGKAALFIVGFMGKTTFTILPPKLNPSAQRCLT
jgi:hypothetical protein